MSSQKPKRFDGSKWYRLQIEQRTQAALAEQGMEAIPGSAAYKAEYRRQMRRFSAERQALKEQRSAAHAAREARRQGRS